MPKRKTRKGGQKVRTQQINKASKQICQHKNDCCAEVFYALGYMSIEDSIYLANLKPAGLTTQEVVNLLKEAYGPSIREVPLPRECIIQARSHCDDTIVLNENEATIVSMKMISPTETRAHLFIMFTLEDKKLYAFDPQTGVTRLIDDYVLPFTQIRGVSITLSYIDSSSVVEARTNAITRPMIDHVFMPRPEDLSLDDYEPSDELLDSI
jgi:hypothetical protein